MPKGRHRPRILIRAALLLLAFSASACFSANLVWDNGATGDQNWGSADNWNPADADVTGDDLVFGNDGASATRGTVTSVVDGDVEIGALTFLNLSGAKRANDYFHTVQINDGKTLTVGNTFTLGIDSRDTAPDTTDTVVTVTGRGTLAFDNAAANFNVGNYSGDCCGQNRRAILDMGGLSTFSLNANRLNVGRVGAAQPEAIMTLAESNDLTGDALEMGQWNDVDNVLELGQNNTLHFNDIFVAWGTVNIGGTGQLIADSIVMGEVAGGAGKTTARVNLNGGTLAANTIEKGPDLGSGNHVREIDVSSGTIQPGSNGTLHIGQDVDVVLSGDNTNTFFHADAGQSIAVDSVMSGTGGFQKSGNGTLLLNASNSYSGTFTGDPGAWTIDFPSRLYGDVEASGGGRAGDRPAGTRTHDRQPGAARLPGHPSDAPAPLETESCHERLWLT
jgi:autotransporter-associated beta strand protein